MTIYGRIYLTLHDEENALRIARLEATNFLVIPRLQIDLPASISEDNFHPPSLTDIFKFDEMMQCIERKNPSKKLVFCAGRTAHDQSRAAFLIGCHAIVSCGAQLVEIRKSISRLNFTFNQRTHSISTGLTIQSCLSAVFRAKESNWIDFRETFSTLPANCHSIQMEEYMHYAR